jgi:RNA 2',3'-cyclic 3'-phosphodiesterase
MRLFVGIEISAGIRAAIGEYTKKLQRESSGAENKWVKPESLHVTLKFIGENKDSVGIAKELHSIQYSAITLTFKGVGFFTPRKPRVFWAGVEAPPELASLAADIDARLSKIGVPKEPHTYEEYQPHVTLARTGSGRPAGSVRDRNKLAMFSLQELVAKQAQPEFGTMTAEEFILYRSETLTGGSRYTALARFPLVCANH